MEIATIVWTCLGALLVLIVLVDVFLAVLHIDNGGLIAPRLHRAIWDVVMAATNRAGTRHRTPLALAGPLMIVTTFAVWIGLFVTGFALLYLPHLDAGFRTELGVDASGFVDALYFSGNAGTVLGFGEITPVTPTLRVLSFLQAGLGFALFTSVITYLLNVVRGVSDRNAVAVRLHAETSGTGDGVEIVERSLREEEITDTWQRLHGLANTLQDVQEQMYQFPILDVYYRSRNSARDPERMLKTAGDASLAAALAARHPDRTRLRPASEDLQRVVTNLAEMFAAQYFPRGVERAIVEPEVTAADRERLDEIRERLRQAGVDIPRSDSDDEIVLAAARLRAVLDAMDGLSGWRRDLPGRREGARDA